MSVLGRIARAGARAGKRAADQWLPRACALCDARLEADEQGLCEACVAGLPGAGRPRCARCGLAGAAARCAACSDDPPAYDRCVVVADYAPPLDRLIHALKFRGELAHARTLGALLARRAGALELPRIDALVPVPLAAQRLAQRGFNQSHAIGAAVSRDLGIALAPSLLARVRETPAQSTLKLAQRRDNLAGALIAGAGAAGARLALVDDVMTSGATLNAAAAALKSAGAALVINLVVARTP